MSESIPFEYVQGNCHNRAHYMSLLALTQSVMPYKIWAFAPAAYDHRDQTAISIRDKHGISADGMIHWRYHVAPVFEVITENGIEPWVFDPALFPKGPCYYRSWLAKLKTNNLIHLFSNYEWYSFKAWYQNPDDLVEIDFPHHQRLTKLPAWFPKGAINDFYLYDETAAGEHWLAQGLAINETAYLFFKKEMSKSYVYKRSKKRMIDYHKMVGDVNNFETIFRDRLYNDEMSIDFQFKHAAIIEEYRKVYELAFEVWKKKIISINRYL